MKKKTEETAKSHWTESFFCSVGIITLIVLAIYGVGKLIDYGRILYDDHAAIVELKAHPQIQTQVSYEIDPKLEDKVANLETELELANGLIAQTRADAQTINNSLADTRKDAHSFDVRIWQLEHPGCVWHEPEPDNRYLNSIGWMTNTLCPITASNIILYIN